jgi:hypothetical protein
MPQADRVAALDAELADFAGVDALSHLPLGSNAGLMLAKPGAGPLLARMLFRLSPCAGANAAR